jgi:predicted phosphodiesterase
MVVCYLPNNISIVKADGDTGVIFIGESHCVITEGFVNTDDSQPTGYGYNNGKTFTYNVNGGLSGYHKNVDIFYVNSGINNDHGSISWLSSTALNTTSSIMKQHSEISSWTIYIQHGASICAQFVDDSADAALDKSAWSQYEGVYKKYINTFSNAKIYAVSTPPLPNNGDNWRRAGMDKRHTNSDVDTFNKYLKGVCDNLSGITFVDATGQYPHTSPYGQADSSVGVSSPGYDPNHYNAKVYADMMVWLLKKTIGAKKKVEEVEETKPVEKPSTNGKSKISRITVTLPDVTKSFKIGVINDVHLISDYTGCNTTVKSDTAMDKLRAAQKMKSGCDMYSSECWESIIETMNEQNVDLVVLAGDIMDYYSSGNASAVKKGLKSLNAPYMYLRANNDYNGSYASKSESEVRALQKSICKDTPSSNIKTINGVTIVGITDSENNISNEQWSAIVGTSGSVLLMTHVPYRADVNGSSLQTLSMSTFGKEAYWTSSEYQSAKLTDNLISMIHANERIPLVVAGHLHGAWDGQIVEGVQEHIFAPGYKNNIGIINVVPESSGDSNQNNSGTDKDNNYDYDDYEDDDTTDDNDDYDSEDNSDRTEDSNDYSGVASDSSNTGHSNTGFTATSGYQDSENDYTPVEKEPDPVIEEGYDTIYNMYTESMLPENESILNQDSAVTDKEHTMVKESPTQRIVDNPMQIRR